MIYLFNLCNYDLGNLFLWKNKSDNSDNLIIIIITRTSSLYRRITKPCHKIFYPELLSLEIKEIIQEWT